MGIHSKCYALRIIPSIILREQSIIFKYYNSSNNEMFVFQSIDFLSTEEFPAHKYTLRVINLYTRNLQKYFLIESFEKFYNKIIIFRWHTAELLNK